MHCSVNSYYNLLHYVVLSEYSIRSSVFCIFPNLGEEENKDAIGHDVETRGDNDVETLAPRKKFLFYFIVSMTSEHVAFFIFFLHSFNKCHPTMLF